MLANVRANANLPDLRAGETATVDLDDDRWFRRAASGLVTVLSTDEPPPPPPLGESDAGDNEPVEGVGLLVSGAYGGEGEAAAHSFDADEDDEPPGGVWPGGGEL